MRLLITVFPPGWYRHITVGMSAGLVPSLTITRARVLGEPLARGDKSQDGVRGAAEGAEVWLGIPPPWGVFLALLLAVSLSMGHSASWSLYVLICEMEMMVTHFTRCSGESMM